MLKYLIIQLDDTAVSFCHYDNPRTEPRLIPLEQLREAIFWSMKENLSLQFLYPDYELPQEYKDAVARTYHADIVSGRCADTELRSGADVVVFDSWDDLADYPLRAEQAYAIRSSRADLISHAEILEALLPKVSRLNVVITDIAPFGEAEQQAYRALLDRLSARVAVEYRNGHGVQLNLLTDRLLLDAMNNCNAGHESITLAPDGRFYVCPAFYADGKEGYSIGDLDSGLDIKNPQLYRLDHAPICRRCDAWQCRRCVWLNRRLTLEVNTPGHEQCVMAHLERNASRALLGEIRKIGIFRLETDIPEIDYLDPFDEVIKNQ